MKSKFKLLSLVLVLMMVLAMVPMTGLAATIGNSVAISLSAEPSSSYIDGTVHYTVEVENVATVGGAVDAEVDVLFTMPAADGSATGTVVVLATDLFLGVGDIVQFNSSTNPELAVLLDYINEGVAVIYAKTDFTATYLSDPPFNASGSKDIPVFMLTESLSVSKTAAATFNRAHEWDIDKYVTTENGETIDRMGQVYPKIWLYQDGTGDEIATWDVDVTYVGYEETDVNVSGEITIVNDGDLDAVIVGVVDTLAGTPITVQWPIGFAPGDTLAVGETLKLTYSEDVADMVTGVNMVTVTTEKDTYNAQASIVWGDPDEEMYKVVDIKDVSDLFGEVTLGTLDAADYMEGQVVNFDYDKLFKWTDYVAPGPYDYDNTATIVQTGQSATAKLVVNWIEPEELTVRKTAVTTYNRTHEWDIDKYVTTENGETIDRMGQLYPKIWLYQDGTGDEIATWNVDVTYVDYEDSDFNVSGVITIVNTGGVDAVIENVVDTLAGTAIDVQWPVGFAMGDTLAPGETLTLTYSEDVADMVIGVNTVAVTTEIDVYNAEASIVWGDPDEEMYKVVDIKDVSDLFGEVTLGTLDADSLMPGQVTNFDYDKLFKWTDYVAPGPYDYDNTATIVQTGQSATAKLVVNWVEPLCYGDETAWAYGGNYAQPNWDFVNNQFWGWTNGPLVHGTYTWDIYAGAGQNILSKGEIVGELTVVYTADGTVTVTYQMDPGNYLGEVHLWVGNDVLPKAKRGYTNAPGQFPYKDSFGTKTETTWTWSGEGFEGDIYVAAHSVVWMVVPCEETDEMIQEPGNDDIQLEPEIGGPPELEVGRENLGLKLGHDKTQLKEWIAAKRIGL